MKKVYKKKFRLAEGGRGVGGGHTKFGVVFTWELGHFTHTLRGGVMKGFTSMNYLGWRTPLS